MFERLILDTILPIALVLGGLTILAYIRFAVPDSPHFWPTIRYKLLPFVIAILMIIYPLWM